MEEGGPRLRMLRAIARRLVYWPSVKATRSLSWRLDARVICATRPTVRPQVRAFCDNRDHHGNKPRGGHKRYVQ